MEGFLNTSGPSVHVRPVPAGRVGQLFQQCVPTLVCLVFLAANVSFAHDDKPQHGGVLSVENDIAYELVTQEDRIVLYVNDHDTPVSLAGASGYLVVGSGKNAARYPFKQVEADGLAATGAKWPSGQKATIALQMRSGRHIVVSFSPR